MIPLPSPDSSQNFDRFIPSRQSSNLETAFVETDSNRQVALGSKSQNSANRTNSTTNASTFNSMLRNELLQNERDRSAGSGLDSLAGNHNTASSSRLRLRSSPSASPLGNTNSPGGSTIFSYKSRRHHANDDVHHVSFPRSGSLLGDESTPNENRFQFPDSISSGSGSPQHLFQHAQMLPQRNALLQYSRNQAAAFDWLEFGQSESGGDPISLAGDSSVHRAPQMRKIARAPFKILDAPNLQDDYYLNLLNWSSQNILAVGLGASVFLWSGYTAKVSKLCDVEGGASVSSISWTESGDYLAVGTSDGKVQLWDPKHAHAGGTTGANGVKVRDLVPHTGRVGTLSWHNSLLASGSRDRTVHIQDVRVRSVESDSSSPRGTRSSPNSRSHSASPHRMSPGGSRQRPVSSNDLLLNPSITSSVYDDSPRTRPSTDLIFPDFAPEDEGGHGGPRSSVVDMIAQVTQSRPPTTPGTAVPPITPSGVVGGMIPSTPLPQAQSHLRLAGVNSDPSHLREGRLSIGGGAAAFSPLRTQVGTLSYNRRRHGGRAGGLLLPDPVGTSTTPSVVFDLQAHKQEVCGLKWSPNGRQIATGGNDNKLYIWDIAGCNRTFSRPGSADTSRSDSMDETVINSSFSLTGSGSSRHEQTNSSLSPLFGFSDHVAAVKAVAWSPHQNGLLASGGGTADRTIRYWNTLTGSCVQAVDTGSQVCNLVWSTSVNEVVSTHGYSLNQIIVWKYPSMHKIATLTGHSTRVVYLAMSPDGQSIVTGAGDETLRFWHLFPSGKSNSLGDGGASNSKYVSSVHNHLYERNSLNDGYARCGNVSNVLVPTGGSIR